MKTFLFPAAIIALLILGSCTGTDTGARQGDVDAQRADSMWKVHIADSVNRERSVVKDVVADTGSVGVEAVTREMKEGLNTVQRGLDKAKKITEAGSKSAKGIADGIQKTSDAVHKTVNEAKKTIEGE
ncbi:hypothetical protein [Niabella soli]|uniref:Uncharacterized protein n=1 Tax=Niabella soli DSM 19437 TaxID=929713 RepID=W0F752_9BACT|nr:hypothetical protein [Niabella soli]AHF17166.1 hypothetical protein NIASO_02835 [Niabella soli DSM 19437]